MALYKPAGLKRTERLLVARPSVYPHWRSYLRAHGSFRIQDNSSWKFLNWKVKCVSQGRQGPMPSLALESSPIGFIFPLQPLSLFGLIFDAVSCVLCPDLGSRYVVPPVPALTHSAFCAPVALATPTSPLLRIDFRSIKCGAFWTHGW